MLRKWAKCPIAQCAALTAGVLAFRLGTPAQLAVMAAMLAAVLFADMKSALGMYVFMFFMDEVTVTPLLGGSVSRALQLALAARFGAYYIGKLRAQGLKAFGMLRRSDVLLTAFAVAAVLLGLIEHGVSGETASFAVNAGLFILMRPIIREQGAEETLEALLRYFVRGALAAVLVGLLQGRFVAMLLNGFTQSYARFQGTSEPNFMAAFCGAAVHIHLSLERKRARWADALITGVLGGTIVLTYSMTGMICFALTTIALLCIHRANLKPLLARIGLSLPVAAVCFALVSGYVMWRGVDAFNRGMIVENIHENILYVTPEGYEQMRQGADFHDVAQRASEVTAIEVQQEVVAQQAQALANEAQGSALLIRIREALSWLEAGDLDALTSGRYGLLQMKLSDFALLPAWQKAVGTGPDAVMTFQPAANQLNYCHNSYADALYSFGVAGFALIVLYILYLQRRRMFAGEAMTGDVARAIFMGRASLLIGALTLSMHISRVMLFFLIV